VLGDIISISISIVLGLGVRLLLGF